MTDPIIPAFITGGALVIVNAAIIVIQGSRRRDDIRKREKERIEQLLQDKAEQYCLASRNLMANYQEFLTSFSLGKEGWELRASQKMEVERNVVLLLESFQLAFLRDTIGSTGSETLELMQAFKDFTDKFGNRKSSDRIELATSQTDFNRLEQLLLTKIKAVTLLLNKIPDLDLYKLYMEWRKKHPIG
ncbi:MAG: hypothetical protein ABSG21_11565 [Spirochaetia bacterium]|jgi:hypothetical protein